MWKNINIPYGTKTKSLSFRLVRNRAAYHSENKERFRTSRNDNKYAFHGNDKLKVYINVLNAFVLISQKTIQ